MKRLIFAACILSAFAACNNAQRMSDEQIDSANKAQADSLLNAAIEDTTAQMNTRTDSVLKDSIAE